MASQGSSAAGPDLAAGVAAVDILEGRPLLGHVGGEAALITRSNNRLYAIGATCSHYGGPLAEGLVHNGAIKCPWHHAAFNLETGAVVNAPALLPIPCWSVEEHDGIARVTKRRTINAEADQPTRQTDAHPTSIVIIGGGPSTAVAIDTLRTDGYLGAITVVSNEATTAVDRPNLSKDYLAGNALEEWMPLHPDEWYAERNITLLNGRRAAAIDIEHKRVALDDGRSLEYGALILATGASPIQLSLGDTARVHYLRTLEDSRAIISQAATAKHAIVLGASFIGLEVAASLRTRGVEVTVVAPELIPFERILGREVGEAIRALHELHGVQFKLGRMAKSAEGTTLTLDDGSRIDADMIVAGVGVRPNIELAAAAGLTVDKGVVVNEFLQTSAKGVYAVGDIARWPDNRTNRSIRVEHWVVAEQHGKTAARNILGAREAFDAVPFFWSAHYDVTINYVGHAERVERMEIDGSISTHDCAVRYFEGNVLTAVATIGRDRESLVAEVDLRADANKV